MLKTERFYATGVNCGGRFRPERPVEIIGVAMVSYVNRPHVPCFRVRHSDGEEDFMPIFYKDGEIIESLPYQLVPECSINRRV